MRIFLMLLLFISNICSQDKFPASLMEMNKPSYLLENSGPWTKFESDHYHLYLSSDISQNIDHQQIIEEQEKNYYHIHKLIGITAGDTLKKINMWIFKDRDEKYLKTQTRSTAHCLTEYWSVYYLTTNAKGAHELGHLLAEYYWGYPVTKKFAFLIEEGFAYYVDEGRFYKMNYFSTADDILQNAQYTISNILIQRELDYEKQAFVCGAFVKYLIENYSILNFSNLWKCEFKFQMRQC